MSAACTLAAAGPDAGPFTHDLIVLGCGPAGMSAAIAGSDAGMHTMVVDEQSGPGGQIYRNISALTEPVARLLGPDYEYGATLAQRFGRSKVEHRRGATVWDISPELVVTLLQNGVSAQFRARQLILATGAIERATPIPGWTLPGVLNAGAAQIALKSSGSIPAGRIVLAGNGPLLLLVACQLLDAGGSVVGIVETSPAGNRWRALRHAFGALGAPGYLLKGLGLLRRLHAQGVPMFKCASEPAVEGETGVRSVSFCSGGRQHHIDADTVLLHHGVVPNIQVSRLLRVEHLWDPDQVAWRPQVGAFGETSLTGVRIAGDGAGIAGARAAEASGALAALGAALALARLDQAEFQRRALPWQKEMKRHLRIRPFLEELYRPPQWLAAPADDTIVCRCEEVSAGKIREMARLGCQGPNQTKFFSRCGMGPCQGRMCGSAVTQILSASLGRPPDQIGAYHVRAPLKPIPLSAVAAMASPRIQDQNNPSTQGH